MNIQSTTEAGMQDPRGTPSGVLIRDFLIFQLKTVLDGMKDAVVIPFSIIALVMDLLGSPSRRGRTFYALLGACESFDRWLNLYKPSSQASGSREGLFAGSDPGDGTLAGDIEGWVARRESGRPAPRPGVPGAF